ncbi:6e455bb8-410f-4e19-98dd-a02a81c11656 [Thermothielavioides terrestris]|uniref:glycogenin glucosyltransferase n=1 Tax=Thermothielavioides terrestris TaxID=2587410 RepID=A0A3S4BJ88_9PEZI|nr:6e455bb8-410f-4e19-98dd-a02a81c11656 [Thermothielavioides terrestris]
MAVQGGEDVYASLLLTDTYLPGALVLAHSLRDAGTTKKLAILVTLDTVSADVAVYDYVIPVSRIRNEHPANLDLMNRPDLHSAFTKINLWRQTQFRKIVYMDADMVAYRAPDELFSLDHAFSAAPDVGWPDLFNTGLMVLTPNMGDYYALMAMAQRGISFDGADQGLLNMYFKNSFNRLSFTYNVTPSAHYQYVPAYKHFQSSINVVHFIGPDKPWIQGRDKANGSSPFDQMVGRWWAVYDRHYRKETPRIGPSQPEQQVPEIVQFFVKGEYQPTVRYVVPVGEPPRDEAGTFYDQHYQPPPAFGVQYPQQQHPPHQSHLPPERQSRAPTVEPASEPQTPPGPASRGAPPAPLDIWSSFPRTNAWDNVPEINRYVEKVQKQHRRTQSRNLALGGARGPHGEVEFGWARRGSKVTDFPSEDDRPSLPVTPAPIRRPRRWGGGGPGAGGGTGGEDEQLQAAEGVPAQSDWDPAARLKKLAREQSELLRQRLGGGKGLEPEGREISSRPLPLGSEDARSPTYVAPAPPAPLVSPKPVKPLTGTSPVSKILAAAPDINPSPPAVPAASTEAQGATDVIQTPSYQGPGLAFEKGEDVPAYETPALPTEEERDVLET